MKIDWNALFIPDAPILETFLRGTLVYLGLFLLFRLILKRETSGIGIADLLVAVLLASAVQNALIGDTNSITDGLILVLTILFWSYFLDWLGFRFPIIQRIVHPPPLKLVKEGQILWRNLKHELITQDELMSVLRQQGVDDLSQVKEAFMEGDGRISVVATDGRTNLNPPDSPSGV